MISAEYLLNLGFDEEISQNELNLRFDEDISRNELNLCFDEEISQNELPTCTAIFQGPIRGIRQPTQTLQHLVNRRQIETWLLHSITSLKSYWSIFVFGYTLLHKIKMGSF